VLIRHWRKEKCAKAAEEEKEAAEHAE